MLYVGLGGVGCSVLRLLKSDVDQLGKSFSRGVAFVGLDTQPPELVDVLAPSEYIPMALGVCPEDAARAQPQFLDWYDDVARGYHVNRINKGADQVKPVGRLAFRYEPTITSFLAVLERAWSRLQRLRDQYSLQELPKVYVISTLAGGTGSGCLLDVLFLVGSFLKSKNITTAFETVVILPDVLIGEAADAALPRLYANTYATLRELNHFLNLADIEREVVSYNHDQYSKVRLDRLLMPQRVHLVGSRNEDGKEVVATIEELEAMVASYLLSEVRTPRGAGSTGGCHVFDYENNATLNTLDNQGMPRQVASFGLARAGLPDDVVSQMFALRLVSEVLARECACRSEQELNVEVDNWLQVRRLKEAGVDQLQQLIENTAGGEKLRVAFDVGGKLQGVKNELLVPACTKLLEDIEKTVKDAKLKLIHSSGSDIAERALRDIAVTTGGLAEQRSVGEAVSFLRKLGGLLSVHQGSLKQEITEARNGIERQNTQLDLSIKAIGLAVQSHWWEKKRRIRETTSEFGTRLQKLMADRIRLWVKEQADAVYARLLEEHQRLMNEWFPVWEAMQGRARSAGEDMARVGARLDNLADIEQRGSGNRFSLVDAARAWTIFEETMAPDLAGATKRVRERWWSAGALKDSQHEYTEWLSGALPPVEEKEVRPKLAGLSFTTLLDRFYGDRAKRRKLFAYLRSFSSPMFWADPNRKPGRWDEYWVVACHPGIQPGVEAALGPLLQADSKGVAYALFDSNYEIILYQLKGFYAIHHYQGLPTYRSHHDMLDQEWKETSAKGQQGKPLHAWKAWNWPGPEPSEGEDESRMWFILGRAFSYLYPTPGAAPDDDANHAFIYARGSTYFLDVRPDEEGVVLGRSLVAAVRKFETRLDWQDVVRTGVMRCIADTGRPEVRRRLEQDYLPILEKEIGPDRKYDRAQKELKEERGKLKTALRKFIEQELTTSRI
jgi:hypothetical protein